MMVQFHGCMLGLKGKQNKWLKKPWTLATNDRRVVELFAEMQCNHNSNQHEPCEGGNAARTAYYTVPFVSLIAEALYPKQFYTQRVPAMSVKTTHIQDNLVDSEDAFVLMFGLVIKALRRHEWLSNPKALEAIRKESDGLRSDQTWDDETACDADELTRQSKILSKDIKVAELLILCGIKHAELDESKQKYKGRIVYRGDNSHDSKWGHSPLHRGVHIAHHNHSAQHVSLVHHGALWMDTPRLQQTLYKRFCRVISQKMSRHSSYCPNSCG